MKPLITFLLAMVVGVFLFCFFLLLKNIALPRHQWYADPILYGLQVEPVSFITKDRLTLRGWWVFKGPREPTIVICHGLGTNRSDPIDFAAFLARAGFNLLMFDFRAHGESDGQVTSYGYRETRDLEAALDYLDQRPDLVTRSYGVFGISMGGAVALLAAAKDQRIKAVVVDSPYADLARSITRHIRLMYHLPAFPFAWCSHLAYEIRFLTPLSRVSPIRVIAKIAPRPVFVICGELDDRMPPQEAQRLINHAKEPKELWIVPHAEHLLSFSYKSAEYERRVVAFFRRYLTISTGGPSP